MTDRRAPVSTPILARLLLAAYVVVLLVASWRRWGDPVSDVGLDLTIAAHWTDGLVPYRDVRYWYGPLGIGTLTATFGVFGANLWTAVATGMAITAAIAELSRRIARRWLDPVPALGVVAVVLSIAFSGTLFDFVLPHTFAATTGLVALLAAVLALTHGRFGLAGSRSRARRSHAPSSSRSGSRRSAARRSVCGGSRASVPRCSPDSGRWASRPWSRCRRTPGSRASRARTGSSWRTSGLSSS